MKQALTLFALLAAALGSAASLHAAKRRPNAPFVDTDDRRRDGFPSRRSSELLGIGEQYDRPAISLAHGSDKSQQRGPHCIASCKWHNLAVGIRRSQSADGHDMFSVDDFTEPAALLDGLDLHKDFQHFLQLGGYQHPKIATDSRFAATSASAQGKPLEVFILAGQSNMEGQRSIDHGFNGGKRNPAWPLAHSKSADRMTKLMDETGERAARNNVQRSSAVRDKAVKGGLTASHTAFASDGSRTPGAANCDSLLVPGDFCRSNSC